MNSNRSKMTEKIQTIAKEISWLSFNERVLQEVADVNVPVIDRIRFLGIYSSNLDEFYQVRFAKIRRQVLIETAQGKDDGSSELMQQIIDKVAVLTDKFRLYAEQAFVELKQNHIHLIFNDQTSSAFNSNLSSFQINWLRQIFNNRIIRHITPIIFNNSTTLSDCLEDYSGYFLVALHKNKKVSYALVEIPSEDIERFIVLPTQGSKKEKYICLLDDIIQYFIGDLFKGFFEFDSIEAYSLKITRDAEFNLTDELDESLLEKMSKGLRQRLTAEPVRLVYDKNMPEYMQRFLRKKLAIKHVDNLVPSVRYRNFKDFIKFPNLGRKNLEHNKIEALDSSRFVNFNSVFDAITAHDILLYYPYHKFRHFTEFVRQASYDPLVSHIKINIYRVAKQSRIIHSLTEAVKNGKKVTVVVELRARFDEEANISWARFMKQAGIHVEFGIESLKVHSKLCVVTRKEELGICHYAHIGTGNFHENNARIYTDFALFTKNQEIAQEVNNVFAFIEQSYKRFRFNHLLVSPLTARRRIYSLIDHETQQAKLGNRAEITIKVNNLVDPGIEQRIYKASQAGVKIKMIVRGMCSVIPGLAGVSDNIKIISIVDQFLEHPRVMYFYNSGQKLVYISSADWMTRNLDQRVEVACPIYDAVLKRRIMHTLDLHFKDTTKARIINKEQDNRYVARGNRRKIRSQIAIYDYLVNEELKDNAEINETLKSGNKVEAT